MFQTWIVGHVTPGTPLCVLYVLPNRVQYSRPVVLGRKIPTAEMMETGKMKHSSLLCMQALPT